MRVHLVRSSSYKQLESKINEFLESSRAELINVSISQYDEDLIGCLTLKEAKDKT